MEVLLLQDINGIGKKNDLLIVGDGYALNFLLPESKALIATPTVRMRFSEQIKRRGIEAEQERSDAASSAKSAAGKTVEFERKTTKTGKLYAAITEKHIVDELKKQYDIEVPQKDLKITDQIKATGEFAVAVKSAKKDASMTVVVKEQK